MEYPKHIQDMLMVIGRVLFVVGCWLLVVGCLLLVIGCWLFVVCYWLLAVGCWLFVVGYWLLVVGIVYWWLVFGRLVERGTKSELKVS